MSDLPDDPYARYRPYLGATYVSAATDAAAHAVMVIGSDRWSIARFVREVGVTHLRAARTITEMAKLHRAQNLAHFYETSSPISVAEVGFGIACLFTLFRTFESQGHDVMRWAQREGPWSTKVTTFAQMKRRAAPPSKRKKSRRR